MIFVLNLQVHPLDKLSIIIQFNRTHLSVKVYSGFRDTDFIIIDLFKRFYPVSIVFKPVYLIVELSLSG